LRSMRIAALLALLASLALAPSASAATACDHPASAYSTGAPADVSNPGAQPVNDPIFPDQWGLRTIAAPQAWARGDRGAGAIIAVVDTGADLTHPDLKANLIDGADLTPKDTQGCPGPQDENGHGTHVSGIAAAVTGNGIGGAGTAPDARIMPVRVLDADGSAEDQTVIDGIEWAADHHADVINLSVGGPQVIGETPQLNEEIAKAVDDAWKKGSVVVAAAGNESLPLCSYPAAAANAICVGAVDSRGVPSYFSNFPTSPDGSVGVRAPGGAGIGCESSEDIWSSVWPGSSDDCNDTSNGELAGYDAFAGTSMATPFVSGVAAILAAKGLSNGQILECIKATSSNGGSFDPVMGYGIVSADAASKSCTAASTPTRPGASGGGPPASTPGTGSGGGLKVTVKKIGRRKLARTRTLRVTVKSGIATTVKLRAVQNRKTVGRKRVVLKSAGKRTVKLRISRKAAHRLRASRHARVKVRYRSGSTSGTARTR
jgi:subtilisin family serine protease